MTKESIIELQKIDCNCNDCWFMVRDTNKFNEQKEIIGIYAFEAAERAKNKKLAAANEWAERGEYKIAEELTKEANKIKVDNYKPLQLIQYGNCHKFNKQVSFIPNTCQLETQKCFEHRRS